MNRTLGFALAVTLIGLLAGCSSQTRLASLSVDSSGLPPGIPGVVSVEGGGHIWHLSGRQAAIRVPPGQYRVIADPTFRGGWEYRPATLVTDVRARSGTVLRLVEQYLLWPSSVPAGVSWGKVTDQTPYSEEFEVDQLACT
ncbi:MAG: hypothetical protein M0027_10230, partial [Candidatus Dormibacteraeota bacterium]|nr:hypothetical protein [Candidatus Dormibacteraeota bacterium]